MRMVCDLYIFQVLFIFLLLYFRLQERTGFFINNKFIWRFNMVIVFLSAECDDFNFIYSKPVAICFHSVADFETGDSKLFKRILRTP